MPGSPCIVSAPQENPLVHKRSAPGCVTRWQCLLCYPILARSSSLPHTAPGPVHNPPDNRPAVPHPSEPLHVLLFSQWLLPALRRSTDNSVPRSDTHALPRTSTTLLSAATSLHDAA